MKRFAFKLQSLLSYRSYLAQVARREMASAVSDLNDCNQRIHALNENRETAARTLDQLVEKGVGAREFNQHQGFIGAIDRMILDQINRKPGLEKILEEKRAMLRKKTIDKKAMERLQEKQKAAYTQEMLREEQKELDEISSLKKAREIANG